MRALPPVLFFLYFNALFTFENIPSTPAMRLVWKLSIEVVLLLAALAAVQFLGQSFDDRSSVKNAGQPIVRGLDTQRLLRRQQLIMKLDNPPSRA